MGSRTGLYVLEFRAMTVSMYCALIISAGVLLSSCPHCRGLCICWRRPLRGFPELAAPVFAATYVSVVDSLHPHVPTLLFRLLLIDCGLRYTLYALSSFCCCGPGGAHGGGAAAGEL